jgi:multidrug efflux pump subunit AcrA (membrane-fusion protein)
MKKETAKQIGKWMLIALCILVFLGLVIAISKMLKKSEPVVYNINSVKLAKQKVRHILKVQGILEGDPQVKVYPQVPGKFARNAVAEGAAVNKNDVVVYIDRDMVGYQYELAPVKAPISGVVTKLYYIDKGDAVNPQMPVAEVANEDNVKVVFNLGQDDLLKAHKGQKASIYYINDPAISTEGEVFSVPPVIDTDIMAGTIIVKAPNKAKTMKIGMSVNIEILTEEKDSYMVPEKAVLLGESESYIFMNKAGKAVQVKVSTGYRANDMIEINGPFADGDEVVTDGNFRLYDGAAVSTGNEVSQNSKLKSQK